VNKNAERHLAKARDYVARGEEFYRKAAKEIVAAQEADPSVGERQVAATMGRTREWVRALVRWHTNGYPGNGPFAAETPEAKGRGSVEAKRVLRDSSPEQVEEIVASLSPEATTKLARAVSRQYEQRGNEAKRESQRAFRETVGESFADDLDEEQRLRDAESKVFEARRALRDMLALLNEADLEAMRDSWREDFLKTLDDLATRIDLARALLSGTLEEDLARFLSEV
jgi:hypothetical protein